MSSGEGSSGLHLNEAIRRYSDEQKWQAYQDAALAASGKRRRGVIVVGGEPIAGSDAYHRVRTDNALVKRKEKAWKEVLVDSWDVCTLVS